MATWSKPSVGNEWVGFSTHGLRALYAYFKGQSPLGDRCALNACQGLPASQAPQQQRLSHHQGGFQSHPTLSKLTDNGPRIEVEPHLCSCLGGHDESPVRLNTYHV